MEKDVKIIDLIPESLRPTLIQEVKAMLAAKDKPLEEKPGEVSQEMKNYLESKKQP